MKENWSSAHFCRIFPRERAVACKLSATYILRFYILCGADVSSCSSSSCSLTSKGICSSILWVTQFSNVTNDRRFGNSREHSTANFKDSSIIRFHWILRQLRWSFSTVVDDLRALELSNDAQNIHYTTFRFFFRLPYVAAREGHMVNILSMVHVRYYTPLTAAVFTVSNI